MNLIRFPLVSVLSMLIWTQLSFGQQSASALKQDYYYVDSTKKILPALEEEYTVKVRIPPENILDKYKSDPDFNYDGGPKEADDWIAKIRNWINQQLAALRSSKVYYTLLDYLYYSLMIIGLLLIVRGLIKAERRGLLFGKVNNNEIKIIVSDEDISKINFDELISAAISSKQFKLAIRYLFLKSLKLLSEKGLIELRNNKTNYQYLSEIKSDKIADAFRITTNRFEWSWYGDFSVDAEIMKSSQKDFNQLFELMKS